MLCRSVLDILLFSYTKMIIHALVKTRALWEMKITLMIFHIFDDFLSNFVSGTKLFPFDHLIKRTFSRKIRTFILSFFMNFHDSHISHVFVATLAFIDRKVIWLVKNIQHQQEKKKENPFLFGVWKVFIFILWIVLRVFLIHKGHNTNIIYVWKNFLVHHRKLVNSLPTSALYCIYLYVDSCIENKKEGKKALRWSV